MSETVVIDASLLAKWVFAEVYSPEATALLQSWVGASVRILAPGLLTSELSNIVYKRVVRGGITIDEARIIVSSLLQLEITYVYDPQMSRRALDIAASLGLPATYDAEYLALAEREDCACWTADERLWNTVGKRLTRLRWIGEQRHRRMTTPPNHSYPAWPWSFVFPAAPPTHA